MIAYAAGSCFHVHEAIMDEPLLLQNRVANDIRLGESHFREFKSALEGPPERKRPRPLRPLCEQIGEALVAFANADGGELLVGVEDDGTVTGVPHDVKDISVLLAAPRTHVHAKTPLPLTSATRLDLEGKVVLFFSVMKGSTEIYQLPDGRCMRRQNTSTVPEIARQIQFDRQEIRSREYDRQFVDGATVAELDIDLLRSMADTFLRGLSVELYLQQLGIAEYAQNGLRLRAAALMLFAKDSRVRHPRSQIRVLRVKGTELKAGEQYNVLSDEIIQGNILELLRKAWERLSASLVIRTELGPDARFAPKYIYPERACQEALINAIAHRDYTRENGVDVFLFDDRIEIRSPGPLLSTLSVQDLEALEGAHESRNAFVARVLRENKFMLELGEGMRRMFRSMEERELERPRLHSNGTSFTITLPNKSIYDSQQETWLALFGGIELTPHQKRIIVAGIDGRELSTTDIHEAMHSGDNRDLYDSAVTPLRNARVLVQVRTKSQVAAYASKQGISRDQVPKFKIQAPKHADLSPSRAPRTPTRRTVGTHDPDRTAFVSRLSNSVTEQMLRDVFSSVGDVIAVHFPLVDPPRSRFAFIYFRELTSVSRAIERLHGSNLADCVISVAKARPRN